MRDYYIVDRETDRVKSFYSNDYYFRKTTVAEYALWTTQWVQTGHAVELVNRRMHDYDRFATPRRNVTVVPAHGANAVNLLVPKGIQVRGSLGHGGTFSYNDFDEPTTTALRVEIFEDPEFDLTRAALIYQVMEVHENELIRLRLELAGLGQ